MWAAEDLTGRTGRCFGGCDGRLNIDGNDGMEDSWKLEEDASVGLEFEAKRKWSRIRRFAVIEVMK